MDFNLVNRNWRGAAPGAGGFREPPAVNADSYGGWGAQANPALVAQQDEAAQRTGNIEGTGTLTHFRPVAHPGADGAMTNWATQPGGGGRAPAPGAGGPGGFKDPSLGEPTSYEGGRGAPTPIENIGKGFVNPAGGPAYATPQLAGQAFNREAGVGTFRAPGQTLEEIKAKAHVEGSAAAAKNPYYEALGEKVKAETAGVEATNLKTKIATNQATLRKQLEEEVGVPDKEGKNLSLPVDPGFQAIHKKMDRLTMQGVSPEEAYKAVAPELHKHYYTPENLYGAISLMEKQTGQPLPPELKQRLMSGTPEAMETLYPYTRQAAKEPRGVVARTFSPAPAVGPAATQPTVPVAPASTPVTPQAPVPQSFVGGAAEQGEAAGAPTARPMDLGPGWGKPVGGATLPNRY